MIVIVSEAYRSHIAERCGDDRKIAWISNGVDLDYFDPNKSNDDAQLDLRVDGKFIAAYVGTHGMAHGLETVLDTASILKKRKDIVFLLVGDGAERDKLLEAKEKAKLDNVIMLEQRPKSDMPTIWRQTSASLVILRKKDAFLRVVPSKFFESMAMQVPVVLGVQGESARLLKKSEGGVCFEPENSTELAAAITFLADDESRRVAMGLSGRRFVENHYDRSSLAKQYIERLDAMLGSNAE